MDRPSNPSAKALFLTALLNQLTIAALLWSVSVYYYLLLKLVLEVFC